ncbi:MAG: PAS domain S-box protein [Desulfobacter sp.]|nr:PAS domain S-box protein [Desulfobacter sp.]WDP84689.1 MAG: PAS domain S-box protein [Desulfobacter sp.]
MAKFSLDQGKIIEVNPSLCRALGYTQKELMKKNGMGLFPDREKQTLVENGWGQWSFPLVQQSTGKRLNCRILNIVIRREEVPTVISFVSNICESHDLDQV